MNEKTTVGRAVARLTDSYPILKGSPACMEIVLQYRSPGNQLRGIITVAKIDGDGAPRVFVESTPAVSVAPDRHDPNVFIAKCECFKLAGDGATPIKAVAELHWTLRCYLEDLLQMGDLVSELERLGWKRVEERGADVEGRLLLELRAQVQASTEASETLMQVSARNTNRADFEAA